MITGYTIHQTGNLVMVTAISDLSGAVIYHWYVDGAYVGQTLSDTKTVHVEDGEQIHIDAVDTLSTSFDPLINAPPGFPRRRTLAWCRSLDLTTVQYRVEQQRAAEGYLELARVNQDDRTWYFTYLTPRLDDLTSYTWRIVPMDAAGNDGTAIVIGPELIVGTPDAPRTTTTYDSGTGTATIAEVV